MLTVRDGALLTAGIWFAGASTFFYRRKQTLPFKVEHLCKCHTLIVWIWLRSFVGAQSVCLYCPQVAYFMSWPTLGSAIILVMMPSEEKMKQVSRP